MQRSVMVQMYDFYVYKSNKRKVSVGFLRIQKELQLKAHPYFVDSMYS